jgi:hypothetical protein
MTSSEAINTLDFPNLQLAGYGMAAATEISWLLQPPK